MLTFIPYEDAEMIVRTRYQRRWPTIQPWPTTFFHRLASISGSGTRLGNYVQYGQVTRLSGYLRWPLVELDGSTATRV